VSLRGVTDRPRRLVVVAGTGTAVGKTWAAAALARRLVPRVAVRKPVQSYDARPTDAEVLAEASGEAPTEVCVPHRSYELAVAPFMAAARLGRPPFTLDDLIGELAWPAGGVDVGVVEAAGGVRSPITSDGADTVDLCDRLRPDLVVLVAEAGLGTLNAVRLCLDALDAHPVTVLLNRFDPNDPLHVANRDWLAEHVAAPVVTDVDELPV
jgi:dethiobiotin synthetase